MAIMQARRTGARGPALAVAVVAALIFSAGSLAGPKTTAPSNKVTVLVLIDDKGIKVHRFVQLGNEVQNPQAGESEASSIQTLLGPVPRGDYLSFNIFNRGKKVHNFTIFGKRTPPIKPGRKAHLFAQALTRGTFPYRSTLDKSKTFRGTFTVY
jgi:hypothetical protein